MWWWLFPHLWGFGESVRSFISRLCFFFFFKVEISSHTLIWLFRPGSVYSGSVSWDNSGQLFPDESRVTWFPGRFPYYALTYALFAEWQGSFMCNCSNMGVEWMPNKSPHTKLTLQKTILPPLLPGFKLATCRSCVWCSNQQAIRTPIIFIYI